MRSPTGDIRDIRPAGVAAMKRLGWTEEASRKPPAEPKPEQPESEPAKAPAKKAPAKRARRKPAGAGDG